MTEYRKAHSGELPQIIEFINMVFSLSGTPHDFASLLPKLYGDNRETESLHYLALEDGIIKAVVGSFPVTLCCSGRSLTCAAIGSVAVHPDSRKKGYMKQLMKDAITDMKECHIELSCLTGLRQRYRYFGYEPCGGVMTYRFSRDNFRHCSSLYPHYSLRLREVTAVSDPVWKHIIQLHGTSSFRTERASADFADIAGSWFHHTFAFFHNDLFAGYMVAKKNTICELMTISDSMIFSCLETCFSELSEEELCLEVYPHETSRMEFLSVLYERWQMRQDDNYQILDYEAVLSFFMNLKVASEPLSDGTVLLSIQDFGNYRIAVKDGVPSVSRTKEVSPWQLSSTEAARLFFSPDRHDMRNRLSLESRINWFPLPLSMCCREKC